MVACVGVISMCEVCIRGKVIGLFTYREGAVRGASWDKWGVYRAI